MTDVAPTPPADGAVSGDSVHAFIDQVIAEVRRVFGPEVQRAEQVVHFLESAHFATDLAVQEANYPPKES